MLDWTALHLSLKHFFHSELGRVGATSLVILACLVVSKLWQHYLNNRVASHAPEAKRERLVWAKNAIWVVGTIAIITIWASKIAGFALSVAAFAGAILLVSKELLMCFMGYGLITFTRPYRIGDFVEINGYAGKVIDIDGFATTLAETGAVHQLTGKTIVMPNSAVLSHPVRNVSATGQYMVNLYKIAVPFDIDLDKAETAAVQAAEAATAQWREQADRHLRLIEDSAFLDLPSSRPKVLWASVDAKYHVMTVRFACPVQERVATEQTIFRDFWRGYRRDAEMPKLASVE